MSHLESLPLYIAALYFKPLEQFHSFKDFGLYRVFQVINIGFCSNFLEINLQKFAGCPMPPSQNQLSIFCRPNEPEASASALVDVEDPRLVVPCRASFEKPRLTTEMRSGCSSFPAWWRAWCSVGSKEPHMNAKSQACCKYLLNSGLRAATEFICFAVVKIRLTRLKKPSPKISQQIVDAVKVRSIGNENVIQKLDQSIPAIL